MSLAAFAVRVSTVQALRATAIVEGVAVATPFDVFLSHNSSDKPAVIALAESLRARKIKVWLDVWELVPGQPWQVAIERVIETVASAIVVVGKDGKIQRIPLANVVRMTIAP